MVRKDFSRKICEAALFAFLIASAAVGVAEASMTIEQIGALTLDRKSLWSPGGLALGQDGTLYVVDSYLNHVIGFDVSGTFLGEISIPSPSAVAVAPDDALYIGSHKDMSVAVYRTNQITGYLGKGAGEFSSIRDLAVDPVSGHVYVVDNVANKLKVYDSSGKFSRSFGDLSMPRAVAVTETGVYVIDGPLTADRSSARVRITMLDKSLRVTGVIDEPLENGDMKGASDIAVSGAYIFISDAGRNAILVYEQGGGCIGEVEAVAGDLSLPVSLAVSADGKMFVSSNVTNSIHVFAVGSGEGR